jgi:DNA repair photolyase
VSRIREEGAADYKLDAAALWEFGCVYCSSNAGNYLRIHREEFADLTEVQTGQRSYPADDPALMLVWTDVEKQLEAELASKPKAYGAGKTLVFSMLTDGFSPTLVGTGVTERVLSMLVEGTSFRIRVLTKNAVVGSTPWLRFFREHRDRFVVGLSIGSLGGTWTAGIERRTSSPPARLEALRNLQRAGIATYGMLCPVFPAALGGELTELVALIRPDLVEHIWAEPYNDRVNWRRVRDAFPGGSHERARFEAMFDGSEPAAWSSYCAELYRQLRERLGDRWIQKLQFLLYEGDILPEHAAAFAGFDGVILQGKPDETGVSKNSCIAALQRKPDAAADEADAPTYH